MRWFEPRQSGPSLVEILQETRVYSGTKVAVKARLVGIWRHKNALNLMNWRTRLKVILASLANLLVLSYVAYLTGDNFLFFVFFFIPVALCGWHLGRLSVFLMSVLSGMSWCVLDILSKHEYPSELFRYANSLICFLAFATIGLLVQGLRQSLQEQLRARRQLEQALEESRRSAEELRRLQSQMQVVCAWTKRVNVEGRWVALDEFLTDQLNAKVTYGVSPEAMQEVLDNVEQAEAPVTA
jgi:K+-sensing histidine kinase KdpD